MRYTLNLWRNGRRVAGQDTMPGRSEAASDVQHAGFGEQADTVAPQTAVEDVAAVEAPSTAEPHMAAAGTAQADAVTVAWKRSAEDDASAAETTEGGDVPADASPADDLLPHAAPALGADALDSHRAGAMQARREERWADAREHLSAVLAGEPADCEAALGLAEVCRALGDVAGAEAALLPFLDTVGRHAGLAFSHALNAEAARDFPGALARWNAARQAFPDVGYTWAAEATVLSILGRVDEAEEVLEAAVARRTTTIEVLAARLRLAVARGNWVEALRRSAALERTHADHPYATAMRSDARRKIDAAFEAADPGEIVRMAAAADGEREWAVSAMLWEAVRRKVPDNAGFVVGYGRALREAGQFAEADRVLRKGMADNPANIEIAANYAEVPASGRDWPEAARRWRDTIERFPDARVLWTMAATAFREADHVAAAERLLEHAVSLEPDRVDLRIQQARTAEKAGDWSKAIGCWEAAQKLRPDDLNLRNARGDAIWQQQIHRLENGEGGKAVSRADEARGGAEPDEAEHLRRLALSFEGLGDHCEFGIVQRRFGAEPIGLFRFAAIPPESLISLIDKSFEPLGDPEYTELGVTAGNEYLIRDRRGLYHMHSFVLKDTVDAEKFLTQQLRRLGYLKKKLLEDLREGEKIFVYKSSHSRIGDELIRRLHEALCSFGPNTLLVLRRQEEGWPAGSLQILGRGMLVGYLDTAYGGGEAPIDFASWRKILEAADAHRRAHPMAAREEEDEHADTESALANH